MFISEAIVGVMGKPNWYAWRPTGELIQVTNRGAIKAVRPSGLLPFQPKASDLMSDEWQVGDVARMRQSLGLVTAKEAG